MPSDKMTLSTAATLVTLGGWGSHPGVFQPLISKCPGLTAAQHIPLSWQDCVQDLSALDQAQSILQDCLQHHLIILGWSLGSLLALELALRMGNQGHGCRSLRLILLCPTAAMCPADSRSEYTAVSPVVLKIMQRKLQQDVAGVLQDFVGSCEPSQALIQHYLQDETSQQTDHSDAQQSALNAGLQYLQERDLRSRLENFPYPTLLAAATRDQIVPLQQAKALAQLLPRSTLKTFAAGHNLLLPPLPGLAAAIEQFLQIPDDIPVTCNPKT